MSASPAGGPDGLHGDAARAPAPPPASGDAPQGYTLRAILSQAGSLSVGDAASAPSSIVSSPCFRSAFLWSSGVAALLALHRVKAGGSRLRALNDAALGWMATFGTQWYLCRRDEHDRKLAIHAFYRNQARARAGMRPLEDGGPGGGPGGAGGPGTPGRADAPPPGRDEEWRAEIERMTTYELPRVERGPLESVVLR
jgi:hypothetical protein